MTSILTASHRYFSLDAMSEKKFQIITFGIITLIWGLMSLQGFDMCDEGWVLTGYQQIFNDPESVEYLFLYYGSQFTGGIWYQLFGAGGILAFRIFAVLTMVGSLYIVYLLLKRHISRLDFIIGVMVFITTRTSDITVFHHNHLTTFLYCLTVFYIYRGLSRESQRKIFTGGILLGVTFFARIPNLSLLVLSVLLIPFACRHGISKAVKCLLVWLAGTLAGSITVLVIMMLCGHYQIFLSAITSGFSAVDAEDSTHGLTYMLSIYKDSYVAITKGIIAFFLPGILIALICRKWRTGNIWKTLFQIIATLGYFAVIAYSMNRGARINVIYSFCTFWLIFGFIRNIKNIDLLYLIIAALTIMFFLPLGSDGGIGNMGSSCIIIAIPLGVHFALRQISRLKIASLTVSLIFFLTLYIISGGYRIMSHCYFDEGWRWEKTYRIDNPLANTFTTKKNKQEAEALLEVLPRYVKKGDYTLYFQSIPMLHFLTETKPYTGNPWVWSYDSSNLEKQLQRARKKHKELPVIVREKSCVTLWQTPYKDWNNENAPTTYFHKNGRVKAINRFIKDNNYEVVWENHLFQILLPR